MPAISPAARRPSAPAPDAPISVQHRSRGASTNTRSCARGCGRIGSGAERTIPSMSMISRSRVRAAFASPRCRPHVVSIAMRSASSAAGSSLTPGAISNDANSVGIVGLVGTRNRRSQDTTAKRRTAEARVTSPEALRLGDKFRSVLDRPARANSSRWQSAPNCRINLSPLRLSQNPLMVIVVCTERPMFSRFA